MSEQKSTKKAKAEPKPDDKTKASPKREIDDWRDDLEMALRCIEWTGKELDWENESPEELIKQLDAELDQVRELYEEAKQTIPGYTCPASKSARAGPIGQAGPPGPKAAKQ